MDLLSKLYNERKDVFVSRLLFYLTWMDMYVLRCTCRLMFKEFRPTEKFDVWVECATNGSPNVWNWLKGRNPNTRRVFDGQVAVALGKRGDLEMIQLVNPSRVDHVLANAAANGHVHVIKDWIANNGMRKGNSYAKHAALAGNAEILRLLRDIDWVKVLEGALQNGHVHIVREFRQHFSYTWYTVGHARSKAMLSYLHYEMGWPLDDVSFEICEPDAKEWLWERGCRPSNEHFRSCVMWNRAESFKFLKAKGLPFVLLEEWIALAIHFESLECLEVFLSVRQNVHVPVISVAEDNRTIPLLDKYNVRYQVTPVKRWIYYSQDHQPVQD